MEISEISAGLDGAKEALKELVQLRKKNAELALLAVNRQADRLAMSVAGTIALKVMARIDRTRLPVEPLGGILLSPEEDGSTDVGAHVLLGWPVQQGYYGALSIVATYRLLADEETELVVTVTPLVTDQHGASSRIHELVGAPEPLVFSLQPGGVIQAFEAHLPDFIWALNTRSLRLAIKP
jgi:hypothetical protein